MPSIAITPLDPMFLEIPTPIQHQLQIICLTIVSILKPRYTHSISAPLHNSSSIVTIVQIQRMRLRVTLILMNRAQAAAKRTIYFLTPSVWEKAELVVELITDSAAAAKLFVIRRVKVIASKIYVTIQSHSRTDKAGNMTHGSDTHPTHCYPNDQKISNNI